MAAADQQLASSIEVRWFSTLVKRTNSKLARTTVVWRPGITPRSIFKDEGFADADADHVIAVVNGERRDIDSPLEAGDGLEFLVGISGGERGFESSGDQVALPGVRLGE